MSVRSVRPPAGRGDGSEGYIEDRRDFWWVAVDLAVLRDKGISSSAKLIYAALCTFSLPRRRDAFPSVATLAEQAGVSERQARYALDELDEGGWIQRERRRGEKGEWLSTVYHLVGHRTERGPERDTSTNCPASSEEMEPPVQGDGAPCADGVLHPVHNPTAHGAVEVYKDIKTTVPSVLGGETPPRQEVATAEEESLGPQDAPGAMRETVEFFLAKTGRRGISPGELSAVRALEAIHTPHRVQREISTAVSRFERAGRPPGTLTMEYVLEALKHQRSGSAARRGGARAASAPDPAALSRLADLDAIRREREEAWAKQIET